MKVALVVEGSTKHHAEDVWDVLSDFTEHERYQLGMRNEEGEETLNFLQTSAITAILLNLKAVDFVIGGCGSGQGFFNGVMAYPDIRCGLIYDPLEAWMYMRVNAGNCISLPLNRGGGLAGKEQIRLILQQVFSAPVGGGYPPERAELIRNMHQLLRTQNNSFRKSFLEILPLMDREILLPALRSKGMKELVESAPESAEKNAVMEVYKKEIDKI